MKDLTVTVKSVVVELGPTTDGKEAKLGIQSFKASVMFDIGETRIPFFARDLTGTYLSTSSVPAILSTESIGHLVDLVQKAGFDRLDLGAFYIYIAWEIGLQIILQNPINDLSKLPHSQQWSNYALISDGNRQQRLSFLDKDSALEYAQSLPKFFDPQVELSKTFEEDENGRSFFCLRWIVTEKTHYKTLVSD